MLALAVLSACSRWEKPRAEEAVAVVEFAATDGIALKGDLSGAGERGVVLVHGARYHRDSWAQFAKTLVARGFLVLTIDLRWEVVGGAFAEETMPFLSRDVLGAVRFLRARGATSVSLVGGSIGGFACANAAVDASDGDVDRVVLLAHSPIAAPERMKGAKLFILARDDPGPGGTPRLDRIRDQFERASGPKELVTLDGAAHAQAIFDTDQGPRLVDEIVRFLSAP